MRTYYENPPQTLLAVAHAASKVFAIPYPTRVRLTTLRVMQTSGTPVLFKVDIFNHIVGDAPATEDALYLVTPYGGINSNAAGVMVHQFPDVDNFFQNLDDDVPLQVRGVDTPSMVSILARRVIYIRITNSDVANDAVFSLVLGSEYLGDD